MLICFNHDSQRVRFLLFAKLINLSTVLLPNFLVGTFIILFKLISVGL